MRYNSGLIASMEEIDNAPITDEVEAAEVATTVADDSAEIQTQGDEIGTSVAEVEDAVQGGEELEAIGEVAADAVESGEGLSEDAAEVASIAIESIRSRLGFRAETRLVPATESFGNSNTRLMSTRLVVEGVMDSIKKIWAAIKAAVARVWDKIKSFFAKLFNSASMLGKHINSLRDRARKLPGNAKPMEEKLKAPSLARAFSVKGKANFKTFGVIAENSVKLANVAALTGQEQSKIADAARTLANSGLDEPSVAAFLAAQNTSSGVIEKAIRDAFQVVGQGMSNTNTMRKGAKSKKGATSQDVFFGPFVGGVDLKAEVTAITMGTKSSTRITLSFVPTKEKLADEIEALTGSEVQSLLTDAQKAVNALTDYQRVQKHYDDITKKIVGVAEQVMKSATKVLDTTGGSTDTKQGLQELKDEVSNTISSMSSFGNRAPALIFNLCKLAADYASVSLRNLREDGGK